MEHVRTNRLRALALLLVIFGLLTGIAWGAQEMGIVDAAVVRPYLARIPWLGERYRPAPPLSGADLARAEVLATERAAAERTRGLDERAAALEKAQEAINAEKVRLEAWERDLEVREANLASAQAAHDSREAEVRRLVTLYTGMRPQEAARVFERTDEILVVEILRAMPATNASAVLRVMDPEIAARLTRQMGLAVRDR